MNKQDALDKIEELEQFVEDLDKPKKEVLVYIKKDAANFSGLWVDTMDMMQGQLLPVKDYRYEGSKLALQVYTDNNRKGSWWVRDNTFIIVEGSLDDLKD